MFRKIDWESQIGRRLRLRDLHVFSTVVQRGSMAKAAQQLGVSQPAVSEVIADLEHALGVRLVDRSAQGVEPTIYGDALLRRSVAVFDELKQSIRDIEFLSDPAVGESKQYPRVEVHADLTGHSREFRGLHERKYDCVLQSVPLSLVDENATNELNLESLFDETVVVAAGTHTKWARCRKIDLAELVDEPWALAGPGRWSLSEEIFRARGLSIPKPSVATVSISLRARLLAAGPYLTLFFTSVLRQLIADHYAVTALPVDLPASPVSTVIITLKNRTLSPVVERFLTCVREVAKSLTGKPVGRAARSSKPNVS
jgi:DNA-binding transcriptional LysR family regulator